MKNKDFYNDNYNYNSNNNRNIYSRSNRIERERAIQDISSSSAKAEERARAHARRNKGRSGQSTGSSNRRPSNREIYSRKRKYKKRRILLTIISIILISVLATGGFIYLKFKKILNSANYIDDGSAEIGTLPDEMNGELAYENGLLHDPKVLNIMLFGSDNESRGDSVGGSDSMILVSLDTRRNTIKLTSIMRDLWLKIANGHGKHKLNYAYTVGQEALAVKTIENNFGIKIDRFVTVDFTRFVAIVDSLGGIDLDITGEEAETINRFCRIEGMKVDKELEEVDGVHHLCGVQALNHARDRDTSGYDFGRTQRQRNVFSAMMLKVKSAGVTQLTSFASQTFSNITTNFKRSEITKFLTRATKYFSYSTAQYRVPQNDEYTDEVIEEQMVLLLKNLSSTKEKLANFVYEDSYANLPKNTKSKQR